MVSFQCEACNDTLKKPKLDSHAQRCKWARYTCIDCNVTFQGTEYRAHTACITEDEKYQKTVYKGKKGALQGEQRERQGQQQHQAKAIPPHFVALPTAPASIAAPVSTLTVAAVSALPVVSNGIHPDRQRILDLASGNAGKVNANALQNAANKRKPASTLPASIPPTSSSSAATSTPEVPLKKVKAPDKRDGSKNKAKRAQQELEKAERAAEKAAKDKKAMVESVAVGVEAVLQAVGGGSSMDGVAEDAALAPAELKKEKKGKKEKKEKRPREEEDSSASKKSKLTLSTPTASTSLPALPLPQYLASLLPTLLTTSMTLVSLRASVLKQAASDGYVPQAAVEEAIWEGLLVGGKKMRVSVVDQS